MTAGKEHRYALPDDVLQRQGNDWAAALAYQGYSIRRGKSNAFAVFIQELQTTKFVTCTARVGWHGSAYVMPDTAYGADEGTLVLQSAGHEGLYTVAGDEEAWAELARPLRGLSCVWPMWRAGGFSFEGEAPAEDDVPTGSGVRVGRGVPCEAVAGDGQRPRKRLRPAQ